jgi:hypothetical protein
MKEFEPMVDVCIKIFEEKFAFDVISSITFSNRLGFMEKEEDVGGIIDAIEGRLAYNSIVGQIPGCHKLLLGDRIFASIANRFRFFARLNSVGYIVQFAANQLARYKEVQDLSNDPSRDMLARFKRLKDGESIMSDGELLSHASSNMWVCIVALPIWTYL